MHHHLTCTVYIPASAQMMTSFDFLSPLLILSEDNISTDTSICTYETYLHDDKFSPFN